MIPKVTNHLEIAAKTWAREKAHEISGTVVDHVLNQTCAHVQTLGLIPLAEAYEERFLTAWLTRNLMEFTDTYYRDMEERIRRAEKIAEDAVNSMPTKPITVEDWQAAKRFAKETE